MKTIFKNLNLICLMLITLILTQCSAPEANEFTYDNSKELEKLSIIIESSADLKGLVDDQSAIEYDFDTVLIRTFAMANCKLPNKIAKKIKDDGGLLPPKVRDFFYGSYSQFPKKVYRLPGTGKGIEYVLHLVDIQKASNTGQDPQFRYKNYALDFDGFVLSKFIAEKASNLFYTLDCQGYFNAAIAVHGGLSIFSNIKSEAASNLDEKLTIMIGYAPVVNPFAQAFYNNLPGAKKLVNQERLLILRKLTSIPNLDDSDFITYMTAVNCLFATKTSESNLNGNVNLDVDIKTPVAGAGVSAGLELSRNIKFQIFDTYYVKDDFYSGREKFTVKDLKDKITELENSISSTNPI
jgi:hypothetical protein